MKLLHLLQILLCYFVTLSQCLSHEKLLKEAKKGRNNVIKLTDKNFKRILKGPTDSVIVVFLTATQDSIGCTLCQSLDPEYDILAESWFKTHPDGLNIQKSKSDQDSSLQKGFFLAKADYSDGDNTEVFQHFQAQQVPLMYIYQPTKDDTQQSLYTFQQVNIPTNSEAGDKRIQLLIDSFVNHFKLRNYKIHKPINWGSIAITALSTVGFIFTIHKFKSFFLQILTSRILWTLCSCLFITVMCNGYMFNQIRGAPYAGDAGNGKVDYFQHGMQTQYAVETQIVTFLYGVLGLLTYLLIKMVPAISNYYEAKQKHYNSAFFYMATAGVLLFLVFFFSSGLMFVFRLKYPPYPFKLLK